MPGRMELDFQFTQPQAKAAYKKPGDGPLRILVLGDFSGRAARGSLEHGSALAERPIVSVDVDNFDDVLFRFSPRISIALGEADVTAEFLPEGGLIQMPELSHWLLLGDPEQVAERMLAFFEEDAG